MATWFYSTGGKLLRSRVQLAVGLAIALLLATAAGAVFTMRSFAAIAHQRAEHVKLQHRLELILSYLKDVETAQRGYMLVGKEEFLEPYRVATPEIYGLLNRLREHAQIGELEEEAWKTAEKNLLDHIRQTEDVLQKYRGAVQVTPEQLAALESARESMDAFRESMRVLIGQEHADLHKLETRAYYEETYALAALIIGFTLSATLMGIIAVSLYRQMRRSEAAEHAVADAQSQLRTLVTSLSERNTLITELGEVSHSLQASRTFNEAIRVLAAKGPVMFTGAGGSFYVTRESRDHLELGATWGATTDPPVIMTPDECWALRKGKVHAVDRDEKAMLCPHIPTPPDGLSVCVPMLSQGETRGVLHLEYPSRHELAREDRDYIEACSEQIAMALTNLQLRDRLRTQAIRDPLSGLFNRRYTLDTAERELARAQRQGTSCSFVLMDIDHFKRFNDSFGHDAGDHVIKALSEQLRKLVRGSDVASRYGGEEFLWLMPDATREDAVRRAEDLRQRTRELALSHQNTSLGTVTLSLGIATFPQDGTTTEELIRAADLALYRAKSQGRDQVVTAGAQTSTAPIM